MKIIWLSSYPKSGNTYTRFLLYNYLFGDINTSRDVEQKIPDLHLLEKHNIKLTENNDHCLLMKTHFSLSLNHPYVDSSHQFIYVLRNPRDVIHSGMRYILGTQATPEEKRQYIEDFLQFYGSSKWATFGNWTEHFSSWFSGFTHIPGLFIRYEDLKLNPETELSRMITFLGGQIDSQKLKNAVQASSLDSMKQVEQRDRELGNLKLGTFRKHSDEDTLNNNEPFVGKAKSNQSLAVFGEDLETKFQERFGHFLNLFGYQ